MIVTIREKGETFQVELSAQQEAVVTWALEGRGNLNLVARAGCGKSFTIKRIVEAVANKPELNPRGIKLLAFNVPIADELKAWATNQGFQWNQVGASTFHSAGVSAWRKIAPNVVVDKSKVAKLFDSAWPAPTSDYDSQNTSERTYRDFVIKAVQLAKHRAFGVLCQVKDRRAWFDLVDHFGLDEELEEEWQEVSAGVEMAVRIYDQSLSSCREVIDMEDMILAPLYFKARFWKNSWVIIDEAQDTNPARRALALALLAPGGRLVAVGDPAQAIYGFTGADADAMDLIKKSLNSFELPLNQTRRCPKAVVRLAQQWVPDIEALPEAPEGVDRVINFRDLRKEPLGPDDVILCRKSAPIVDLAYSLLAAGKACKVEGREIGQGLVKLVNRFKVKTLAALLPKLEEYRERETAKWLAKEKEEKAARVNDSVDTLVVLCDALLADRKLNVVDLVSFISGMFQTTPEGETPKVLTLSTVHKSKGREWNRVYLLGRNAYMPSKWARKAWQVKQEDHLCYVAVTRAKEEIVDVMVEVESKRRAV